MAVFADRVAETTSTTGTGTYSLAGASLAHQSFVSGVGTSSIVRYCAYDSTNWEIGEGTVTDLATDTLTRSTILSSSNAGAAVNWSSGVRDIVLVNDASSIQSVVDHLLNVNGHLDWTIDQGANDVHVNNYTNTTYVSSDFSHDSLSGVTANDHIDWTIDQGATNLHAGNYVDTVYTLDKPKVEAVLTGELTSHTHPSDNGYTFVWAEENAALTVGGIFSFGNGATGGNQRLTIPVACTAKVLTISTGASTSGVIELYVNGVATGETLTLTASTTATSNIDYPIAQGDTIHFQCVSGSGGSPVVVGLGLLLGSVAVQGTTGDSAYDAWISEGNVGTVADFLIDITGSDATVTKVAVEAVLTGTITSHNHTGTYQPLDSVLTNTTASFLTADETKLDFVTVTQAVNLDTIETRVNELDAAVVLKGVWDASVGTFPTSTDSGESWIVSVSGTVGGIVFDINDRLIAIANTASTTVYAGNWHKADYTDEVVTVAGRTGAVVIAKADIADFGTYAAPLGGDDNYVTDAEKANLHAPGSDDQVLTGLDYEPTGTAASTMSTHETTHPAPTVRDARNQVAGTYASGTGSASGTNTGDNAVNSSSATSAQGSTADSALQPADLPGSSIGQWGSTDVVKNYNTSVLVEWNTQSISDANFTNTSDTRKTISEAGDYEFNVMLSYASSTAQRVTIGIELLVNGVSTGAIGMSGYSRATGFAYNTTSHFNEVITLSANDYVEIKTSTQALSGNAFLISGASTFNIKKLGGVAQSITDADTLDGQHGAYYSDPTNMNAGALPVDVTVTEAQVSDLSHYTLDKAKVEAVLTGTITSHNHTGTYQPLDSVLTNTTASFLTADQTKLNNTYSQTEVNDLISDVKSDSIALAIALG